MPAKRKSRESTAQKTAARLTEEHDDSDLLVIVMALVQALISNRITGAVGDKMDPKAARDFVAASCGLQSQIVTTAPTHVGAPPPTGGAPGTDATGSGGKAAGKRVMFGTQPGIKTKSGSFVKPKERQAEHGRVRAARLFSIALRRALARWYDSDGIPWPIPGTATDDLSVLIKSLLTNADAHLAWVKWSLLNEQQRQVRIATGPVESRLKPENIPVETSLPNLGRLLEAGVPNTEALASFLNEEEAITSQLSDEVIQKLNTLLPNPEEEMGGQ